MSEVLLYFRFYPAKWTGGRIYKQKDKIQTCFIDLCCKYWNKHCSYTYDEAIIDYDKKYIDLLIEKIIIKNKDGKIQIDFLDEQYIEILKDKEKKSEAGKASANKRQTERQQSLTGVEQVLKSTQQKLADDKDRSTNNRNNTNTKNITKDPLASEQASLAEKEVNEILELFKAIDETYTKHFPNKTQRAAIKSLVNMVGKEKLEEVLKQLPTLLADQFCPRVITPCDLFKNWGRLDKFIKQKQPVQEKIRPPDCNVCKSADGMIFAHHFIPDLQGTYACPICLKGEHKYSPCPKDLAYKIKEKLQEVP